MSGGDFDLEILKKIAEEISDNRIAEALNLVEANAVNLDEYSEFWNMKGIICLKTKNFEIAINCLKKAMEIDKYNVDAEYNLAYAYEMTKNYYNALQIYNKILNSVKDDDFKKEIYSCIDKIYLILESFSCDIIIKNTDKKNAPEPNVNIFLGRSNILESILEDDAPLVSIFVLAYNNLEKYTKTCVQCILKYTKGIDYELILVDNGSSDGTFEYFKTVPYEKKKIIKVTNNIGAVFASEQAIHESRGKYIVTIPNDVYVTENWLFNMLKCINSDEKIGMVNPVCDYVTNLQSVDLGYQNFDDMQLKASKFNVSNPKKWEERLRLITLGTMYKRECLDTIGFIDYGFFHDFGDDDITFRIRHAGYKAILCKDVFVSHAGKITDKGADLSRKSIEKGKKVFADKYYGIDAWDDVNNFESNMMGLIKIESDKKKYNVLGIDVLCGTPLLQAKNRLRSKGIFNTNLSAFTTQAKYWLDLSTICNNEVKCDRIEFIAEHFEPKVFDYIILGTPINLYEGPYKVLDNMLDLLIDDGSLLMKVRNNYGFRNFCIL